MSFAIFVVLFWFVAPQLRLALTQLQRKTKTESWSGAYEPIAHSYLDMVEITKTKSFRRRLLILGLCQGWSDPIGRGDNRRSRSDFWLVFRNVRADQSARRFPGRIGLRSPLPEQAPRRHPGKHLSKCKQTCKHDFVYIYFYRRSLRWTRPSTGASCSAWAAKSTGLSLLVRLSFVCNHICLHVN